MRPFTRAVAAAGALGAGCIAYGCLVERRWYRLRHLTLSGALRRPGRLRILHVSDVHLAPGQDHRVRFLAGLSDAAHDVVVVTGDVLGAVGTEQAAVEAMAPLTAKGQPGLLVLGSNDRFGPVPRSPVGYFRDPDRRIHGPPLDTETLVTGLAAHGYELVHARTTLVETPAGPLAAGGMDDPHLGPHVIPAVAAVTPHVDGQEPVVGLGIVHAPYTAALDVLVGAGHDVLLAGHTHGGQVRLPGLGALVANCDLPLTQARGASRYHGRWLHVSPGLGHSPYAPFRFACRPEATLLELTG